MLPLLVVLTATGCVLAEQSEVAPPTVYIEDDDVLSDHQRETLARFAETGDVSFEDYAFAQAEFLECMTDAGFQLWSADSTYLGYPTVDYTIRIPDAMIDEHDQTPEMDAIRHECSSRYVLYVEDLYHQIQQREAWPRIEEMYAPSLRACLLDRDVDIPSDATFGDLLQLDHEAEEAGLHSDSCRSEVGYLDYLIAPGVEPGT